MYVLWVQGLVASPWNGAGAWEGLQQYCLIPSCQHPLTYQAIRDQSLLFICQSFRWAAYRCASSVPEQTETHILQRANSTENRHSIFKFFLHLVVHREATELYCSSSLEPGPVCQEGETWQGHPFGANMQRQASAYIPGATPVCLWKFRWGQSERTGEFPSFTLEIRFGWCPWRGWSFGQIQSSNTTFMGWEMNLPVLLCQKHILKCCKLISHSSLQHLQVAWTTTLFKISLTLFFVVQMPPDKINNPILKDFPCFTWERKSSKSLQHVAPTLLVSSGTVLLMAFPLRKVWTMVEELFINLELIPSASWALWSTNFYFQLCSSAAMPKLSCTLRKEGSLEVRKCSSRCFQLVKQSYRKSLDVAQQFLSVVSDIYTGIWLLCLPSLLLLLLTTTGNIIRMALHYTTIIMKMSLIHHLDFTAYKTGGGNRMWAW